MSLSRFLRYWHTLKYLKPVQFHGRLWFRVSRPRPDLSPAPALRRLPAVARPPARRLASMTGPRSFNFLNEVGELSRGWEDGRHSKLWLYNLHYFDDLNAAGADTRDAWHVALMDDWIERNPVGAGNGWEPYPASLRIVNWIKRHLDGRPLTARQIQSLAVQVRWLTKRLEWHLLGNHLFANAKALVLAGLFFEGDEADCWRAKGLSIVAQELSEQVLADGGNFERSPMYHAIFLEDLLDLVNIAGAAGDKIPSDVVARWRQTAASMLGWMDVMNHPDDEISLFNDAAIGVAPSCAELRAYGARVGVQARRPPPISPDEPATTLLAESGYVRIEEPTAVALLDVAPVGPDYLPGHAHADTLSFELSVFGQRLIVNGGTSRYGVGPERLRERGTAAHSTVVIDGQDSSEVWGGFRVARRARPFDLGVSVEVGESVVTCSHDGYRRLPGRPVHRREWRLGPGRLRVVDTISGSAGVAQARYHFHPDVRVDATGPVHLLLTLPTGRQVRLHATRGALSLETTQCSSLFGIVRDTRCAVVTWDGQQAAVEFEWT